MSVLTNTEPRKISVPKYFKNTPKKPKEPRLATPDSALQNVGLVILVGSIFVMFFGGWAICWGILGIILGAGLAFWGWLEVSSTNAKNSNLQSEYEKAMKAYHEAYQEAEPKPSDAQMDAWLMEDINRLKKEALKQLDMEPEQLQQDPIIVVGPSAKAAIAVGKDGVVRFSQYDVVIVFLTEYHLAAYTATINMATGTTLRESTQEYHYSDIVSVATRTESSKSYILVYQGENKKIPVYKEFSLSVASGDHIRVVTPYDSPEFLELFESEGEVKIKIPETGADKAVRLIRARLREKKGGARV